MPFTLDSHIDHVALAVPDLDVAETRWRDELGGRWVGWADTDRFHSRQLRYANGAKAELIAPPHHGGGFVQGFLDRFGTRVHHITLKVGDLHAAIDGLTSADVDVVDVWDTNRWWKEAFLRPSQMGGIIVQLAQVAYDDDAWGAHLGNPDPAPSADAARLLGPTLRDPDLAAAAARWRLLGADVERSDEAVTCAWAGTALGVRIEHGPARTAVGVRMTAAPALPPDPKLGPAVLATP